jgi:hypothetical protein
VDTRGWMGGVSRRAILSIKPETFFRAVSETSLKITRSLACKCVKGMTPVEGLSRQKAGLSEGFHFSVVDQLRYVLPSFSHPLEIASHLTIKIEVSGNLDQRSSVCSSNQETSCSVSIR